MLYDRVLARRESAAPEHSDEFECVAVALHDNSVLSSSKIQSCAISKFESLHMHPCDSLSVKAACIITSAMLRNSGGGPQRNCEGVREHTRGFRRPYQFMYRRPENNSTARPGFSIFPCPHARHRLRLDDAVMSQVQSA